MDTGMPHRQQHRHASTATPYRASVTEQHQRPCRSYPHRIEVRASRSEKERITALAQEARVSASRYLVRLAVEGKPPPTEEEREQLRSLRFYLEKVSTNLSQLAHRASRAAL